MTETKRRFKMLMLEGNIPTELELARRAGLSRGSVANAIKGTAGAKAKQAIVNVLRCDDLFPGFIAARWTGLEAGSLVQWPTAAMTAEFLRNVGAAGVEVRKNLVKLLNNVEFGFAPNNSLPPMEPTDEEVAAQSEEASKNVVTFWSPDVESEAIAEAEALANADKQFQGVEKPAKATTNKPKVKGRSAAAPRR